MASRRTFLKGSAALLGAASLSRGQNAAPAIAQAPDELVFCDFNAGAEGWECSGTAFSQLWLNPDRFPRDPNAPFRGRIVGVEGDGYVSSTSPAEQLKALGQLTSPEFTVERPYIHLKVGGYNQPGLSGVQLLIDGQPVRTASGFGTATQGYHKLRPVVWDVRELQGKTARIEVYDRASTSFVMVDSIVFSTSDQVRYRELPDVVAIDAGIQDWLERKVDAALAVGTNPAVASCIVAGGRIVARVVKGERKAGSGAAVELDDAFQLGSGSKPVSGTIAAVMVEDGVFEWDTRIMDILPDIAPEGNPYREVTVAQLMAHLGGLQRHAAATASIYQGFAEHPVSPTEQFMAYLRSYLSEPPVGPPGKTANYGCGSVVVMGMASRLLTLSYEQMLQRFLVAPLGLSKTSSVAGEDDVATRHVWQHRLEGDRPRAESPVGGHGPGADVSAVVGGVNMSVTDVGKYIIAHMPGGAGPRLLTDATLEFIHTPVQLGASYCSGGLSRVLDASSWPPALILDTRKLRAYAHAGSNGFNYFQHYILPDVGIGFTTMANTSHDAPCVEIILTPIFQELLPELLKGV